MSGTMDFLVDPAVGPAPPPAVIVVVVGVLFDVPVDPLDGDNEEGGGGTYPVLLIFPSVG